MCPLSLGSAQQAVAASRQLCLWVAPGTPWGGGPNVAAVFTDLVAFRCLGETEIPGAVTEPLLHTFLS